MNHATYASHSIICMSLIPTLMPNQNRSFRNKQMSKHSVVSPSTSLGLRGLAQARQSRSGEFPLRLGEGTKQEQEQRGISLRRDPSRLGELSTRSKSHSGRLGEPLHISPGRDYQCLPLFAPVQRIHTPNRDFQPVQTPIAIHNLKESTNHNDTSQNTPHEEGLTSLTWK